jgi:hypothetical protein
LLQDFSLEHSSHILFAHSPRKIDFRWEDSSLGPFFTVDFFTWKISFKRIFIPEHASSEHSSYRIILFFGKFFVGKFRNNLCSDYSSLEISSLGTFLVGDFFRSEHSLSESSSLRIFVVGDFFAQNILRWRILHSEHSSWEIIKLRTFFIGAFSVRRFLV